MIRNYHLHLLFWKPPGTTLEADVVPGVEKFEQDIRTALAAGRRDNIFAIPGDYELAGGFGDPQIASIDSYTDVDPPPSPPGPANPCSTQPQSCVTSSQVAKEVEAVGTALDWEPGGNTLVMVYTASETIVCVEGLVECSQPAEACGFHSITASVLAFGVSVMSGAHANCGGGTPNANYAIQLTAHEQNETIVDPSGTGTEIADPCQGHWVNQEINGNWYVLPELLLNGICSPSA